MNAPAVDAHGSAEFDRAALSAWGEAFGASLSAPCVVALEGELGAGKTSLAQAICRGLGVSEAVTSPTFALVHQYRGTRAMVFHLDLYRIGSPRELVNLAWDELVGANAVVLVEWPERAGAALPKPDVTISLAHLASDPTRRRLTW
jgi:tRNA threonylcarbamoyladenosine biosynthesis protein TsaE